MLIDEAFITVKAGNGGPGKVSFFPGGKKTGPDGGDGGNGGNVFVRANRQIVSLEKFTSQTKFKAMHGDPGDSFRKKGATGEDLYLDMPVGTLLRDAATGETLELERDGQAILVCRGGKGGLGNDQFKSSTNTSPRYAQPGTKGQDRQFKLVMRYIADYGLIGLPNAGKSSLLNELTSANVKTANYPFTTLEPNLGVVNGRVIADIPGLIEGASQGKGLGTRFLKHVEKVSLFIHCVASDSADPLQDYDTVRNELSQFNESLLTKPEMILVTKSDLRTPEELRSLVNTMKQRNPDVMAISIHDFDALEQFKKKLRSEEK